MPEGEFKSLNFDFIAEHDPTLAIYAARAERDVFKDPNTSLMKVRQFGESLARHVAARRGLDHSGEFQQVVARLWKNGIVPREVHQLFDWVRMKGNDATHDGFDERPIALAALISAYQLAVWFHRTFKEPSFKPGPFRPPPNPLNVENALAYELESLRDDAARFERELAATRGEVERLDDVRRRLEAESQNYYSELLVKSRLLEESEQTIAVERGQFESELQRLREEASTRTHEESTSFVRRSQKAAKELGLYGDEAAHLPIEQLRIRGPGTSGCCNAPMLVVQSQGWGYVLLGCSECGRYDGTQILFARDFPKLDVWVSCPKCKKRMAAAYFLTP